jgi:hypothetical protein
VESHVSCLDCRQGVMVPHHTHSTAQFLLPRPTMSQAGDSPWHFAEAMGNTEAMQVLEREGATKDMGAIIVPEHVDKIKARVACLRRCACTTAWR